jgi:beta-glucanase (GH16 family)
VGPNGAELALNTYNPTNDPRFPPALYGTHGKTIAMFRPGADSAIALTIRLRLTQAALQRRGLVFGLYLLGCPGSCATNHDEIDVELVTNRLQGAQPQVQLNRYANEALGAGHGRFVNLPQGFDPLQEHVWTLRWFRSRIEYLVDGVLLATETTFVPQGPMHANMNAWGPATEWPDAYDASLQPVTTSAQNQRFVAYVTLVEVTSTR